MRVLRIPPSRRGRQTSCRDDASGRCHRGCHMYRIWVPDLDSPSYFVAIAAVELGFFKQEGIEIEFIHNTNEDPELMREGKLQFGRKAASAVKIAPSPASVDPDVEALRPPGLQQPLPECGGKGLSFLVALDMHHQQPDPPHALALLRPRRERPRSRRAAERG